MDPRVFWKDDKEPWDNPIKEQSVVPYLADEIFPIDPSIPGYAQSLQALEHFYSQEREGIASDTTKLKAYLETPNQEVFFIEGEAGIGKTWFIRYHLLMPQYRALSATPRLALPFYSGIIDLLSSSPAEAEATVYRQLRPILENYFKTCIDGGLSKALSNYATHHYEQMFQEGEETEQQKYQKIRGEVDKVLEISQDAAKRREYVNYLLDVLDLAAGPRIFLVIDNIDRLPTKTQADLIELTRRVLRHARIRLIMPLRDTSVFLRNRFNGLLEISCDDMHLSKLDIRRALEPRFRLSKDRERIDHFRIHDPQFDKSTSYGQIYERIFGGKAAVGRLLDRLADGNCRFAIWMVHKLLMSNQLKGLRHIGNLQFAIAAWMFTDAADPFTPLLVNLFDPGEKSPHKRALVRYRLLELLIHEQEVILEDEYVVSHFKWLGYETLLKRSVVALMEGALARSATGMTPQEVEAAKGKIGKLVPTETGKCYWDVLLKQKWYFVGVQRQLAPRLQPRFVERDPDDGRWFLTYSQFLRFLEEEEDEEATQRKRWERTHGQRRFTFHSPRAIAERALFPKEDRGDKSPEDLAPDSF